MEKELDLRIQKTYKALISALYDLLCEKGIDEISVAELCDRAIIRKATFYKHFGDKYELLTFMIKELQRKSRNENSIGYNPSVPQSYYIGVFRYYIEFLESNERLVSSILNSNTYYLIENIVFEQIKFDIQQHMKEKDVERVKKSNAMLSAIYTGAMVGCGKWWISQSTRPDKEKLISEFSELIMKF